MQGNTAKSTVAATMKFKNGDVSLDKAVESIIEAEKRGEKYTLPNEDILFDAIADTSWWK
ncbi:MAG: hypothetical protein LBB74_02310 [Chitinispirillales bacterium]|jgi:hypothetical protein|nr:hypothetical protein [Chitinispirillales bacterium]